MILRCTWRRWNLYWIWVLRRPANVLRLSRNCWCDHRWCGYRCGYGNRCSVMFVCRYRRRWNYFRFQFRLNHCSMRENIDCKLVQVGATREQGDLLMFWKSVMLGCVFFTCLSRLPLPMNAFPHWLHPNGFSPVGFSDSNIHCARKIPFQMNEYRTIECLPVCDRRCDTKWPFDIKSLGHKSHRNGRSALTPLLWLRWWNNKLPFNGNDLPHSSQAYGRSPVWHRLQWNQFTRCTNRIEIVECEYWPHVID